MMFLPFFSCIPSLIFSINIFVSFIPVIEINNSCSLLVYNKKGSPFVSDYKRDIFDKYTLIYWIQESYPSIFVFFSGDTFVWKAYLDIFAKKISDLF